MIKHISKWLELFPLSKCINEIVTYAFLGRVFSRFGALAKVFTDQGTTLHGEFQELCEKALIDHRMTSRDHHETYRLIEWMV
jgi:transposase-like protein